MNWYDERLSQGGGVALNTFGVAKGNPAPTGPGGVLSGDKGEWLIGFSENPGHCSR